MTKPCPFCGAHLEPIEGVTDALFHPGTVSDTDCLFSGKGFSGADLLLWDSRTPTPVGGQLTQRDSYDRCVAILREHDVKPTLYIHGKDSSVPTHYSVGIIDSMVAFANENHTPAQSTDTARAGEREVTVALELFGDETRKVIELLRLVESERGSMDAEDERLNPYCDDMPGGVDTINLAFDADYLQQVGSEDEFEVLLTAKGRTILRSNTPIPSSDLPDLGVSMVSEMGEDDGEVASELLGNIAAMMSEFVDNWPNPKRVSTALALIAKTLRIALDPPRHEFWGAGESDCPKDIKAGNGELHTLRCKVCGEDNPRNDRCLTRSSALTRPQREAGEVEGLADRLRARIAEEHKLGQYWADEAGRIALERSDLAAELSTLKRSVEEAREALEPFACVGRLINNGWGPSLGKDRDDDKFSSGAAWQQNGETRWLTIGDFRRAARAFHTPEDRTDG